MKPDTLNLIEKKIGRASSTWAQKNIFLNRTPVAYALKSSIEKWDFIKLQSFYKAKDTVNKTKRQPTD